MIQAPFDSSISQHVQGGLQHHRQAACIIFIGIKKDGPRHRLQLVLPVLVIQETKILEEWLIKVMVVHAKGVIDRQLLTQLCRLDCPENGSQLSAAT